MIQTPLSLHLHLAITETTPSSHGDLRFCSAAKLAAADGMHNHRLHGSGIDFFPLFVDWSCPQSVHVSAGRWQHFIGPYPRACVSGVTLLLVHRVCEVPPGSNHMFGLGWCPHQYTCVLHLYLGNTVSSIPSMPKYGTKSAARVQIQLPADFFITCFLATLLPKAGHVPLQGVAQHDKWMAGCGRSLMKTNPTELALLNISIMARALASGFLASLIHAALCSQLPLTAQYPPQSACSNPVAFHSEIIGKGIYSGDPITLARYTCGSTTTTTPTDLTVPYASDGGPPNPPAPPTCPGGHVADQCECDTLCGVTSSCSLGPSPNMTDCQELAETISHYTTSWVDGKGGGTGSGLRTCHFWIRNQSPYTLEMCFKVMAASAFALMGSCDSFKKPGGGLCNSDDSLWNFDITVRDQS